MLTDLRVNTYMGDKKLIGQLFERIDDLEDRLDEATSLIQDLQEKERKFMANTLKMQELHDNAVRAVNKER